MGIVRNLWRLLILASGLRIADQAPRCLRSEAVAMVLEGVSLGVRWGECCRFLVEGLSVFALWESNWADGERS